MSLTMESCSVEYAIRREETVKEIWISSRKILVRINQKSDHHIRAKH